MDEYSMRVMIHDARRVIDNARAAGVHIDRGNVIDLLADNIPESLDDLRTAIRHLEREGYEFGPSHSDYVGFHDDGTPYEKEY